MEIKLTFDVYEYTNCGGRDYNEDATGHRVKGNNGIFLVADGLGGHQYGELASACVRDTLLQGFESGFEGDPGEWLKEKLSAANRNILALQAEKNAVLKSTAVVLTVREGRALWANVGDSRLYYLHDSKIWAYTNDHSVAYKKYRAGEIPREQLATDEDQSCLLRSLGSEDRNEPEFYEENPLLEPGDAFLLCSDGVWEYLQEEEILIDLFKANSARQWAEFLLLRLIDRVRGDHDNLTVLALMIR